MFYDADYKKIGTSNVVTGLMFFEDYFVNKNGFDCSETPSTCWI